MEPQQPNGVDDDAKLRVVRPTYLYQELARELERFIGASGLRPGDALPSERDLCAQLSASRPSLREALRMLELVGLVQTRRGGRSVVGKVDLSVLTDWLARSIPWDDDTMSELMVVRETLEVRAAELAADRITPAQTARIVANLELTRVKVEAGQEVLDEDFCFHDLIFDATGNSVLRRLVDVISGLLKDLRRELLAGAGSGAVMLEDHLQIAEAIATGDRQQAGRAMRHHIAGVSALLDQLLETRGPAKRDS